MYTAAAAESKSIFSNGIAASGPVFASKAILGQRFFAKSIDFIYVFVI
jgi:hypothetical protein